MPDQPSTTARKPRTNTTDLPPTIASEPLGSSDFAREFVGTPDIEMPTVKSKPETELILKSLTKTYGMVAQFVMLVSFQDGAAIAGGIDDLVESWRQLLDDDPKLRKRMLSIVKSSGWGAVISAHIVVALPIAMNHKDSLSHLIKPKNDANDGNTASSR